LEVILKTPSTLKIKIRSNNQVKWNKIVTCFVTATFFLGVATILNGADQPLVETSQTSDQTTLKSDVTSPPKAIASAYFPKRSHQFEPVVEGIKVTHDFVVQNKGNDILKIRDVRTG
jgi:hypothetical protein